jgi:integrase
MGVRGTGVRTVARRGRRVLVIDFRYTDQHGVRRRFKRDAASQVLHAARAEADRLQRLAAETGSPEAAPPASMILQAFVDDRWRPLYGPRYRPGTLERYEALLGQGLLEQLGSKRLADIDGPCVRAFLAGVASQPSKRTGRTVQTRPHHDFVRTLLRAAKDLGELAELPGDLPPRPRPAKKLPDAPPLEEIQQTLALAVGWLRVAIALGIYAGLRSGEIRALQVRDVDLGQGVLRIRRTLSGDVECAPKGNKDRNVPIVPELDPIMREAIRRKLPKARVVLTSEGETPTRQSIWTRLDALQKAHGLPHRSVHQLRHGFCTWTLRAGIDVESVRILAGHTDLATTQRYVHADATRARALMAGATGGTRSAGDVDSEGKER